MKKILLSVALLCAAMCVHAEKKQVIARDTIAWTEGIELVEAFKTNDFGETRVSYKAVLVVCTEEGKRKERKMSVSKATYAELQVGKQAYIVRNKYEDGTEIITKVIAL